VNGISRRRALGMLASAAGAVGVAGAAGGVRFALADDEMGGAPFLDGRVLAIGIPGASAVSAVGTFLPGGPIHDNPVLAAFTEPGRVLDPARIMVGSRSNFGAPKAKADESAGSLLSIDPRGEGILAVPAGFGAAGDQASALGGAVQLYTAQSPNFRNGFWNPGAVTAGKTAVSNPLDISINNAFGRLWPANAPSGLDGPGTSSIDDPDGRPLKGAPNPATGGVYYDGETGRQPAQIIPGALAKGAVGTAFLSKSPDGSGRAVFAVVVADGSIVQEHTGRALDGLAPAGTVQPLAGRSWEDQDDEHAVTPRLGAIVNYTPTVILYVSQPFDNSILAIDLGIGGPAGSEVRVPAARRVIRSEVLDQPVALAPAATETQNPDWASNTTMEEGTDLYVCNRGSGTIARLRQDGSTVAVRRVRARGRALGNARLNGIATSPDHARLWVTFVGRLPGLPESEGGVIELPAF
jgi:hypothetical protein